MSRECRVHFFGAPLPPFIVYVRERVWDEVFYPCPRAMFGASIVAATICRDTNAALRVFYLLSDDNLSDGWHPCPPGPDAHGGRLILASSIGAGKRAVPCVPTITADALAKWRANQQGIADYWTKFRKLNPVETWPAMTSVIVPEPPKPKGWFDRLLGR